MNDSAPDALSGDSTAVQENPFELQENPFELACQAARIGVWDWDLVSGAYDVSPLAREIQGFSHDEQVTLAKVRALCHPDDLAKTQAVLERALDPQVRSRERYIYRIQDPATGEIRWMRAHGVARFAEVHGKIQAVHYSGSIEDITDREKTRLALAESEARLRVALDAAQMAVWELDIGSDTLTPSVELNRLYGFPNNATPSADDFRACYAPGEAERLARAGAEVRARGESQIQTAVRHRFPDGSERVFMLRAALAPPDGSGRERAIGVVFDVTRQANQEDRLKAAARELRHRLMNMAALMGAIAGRTWPRDERYESFRGRLRALSASADLMFGTGCHSTPLGKLIEHVLEPFREADAGFAIDGPEVSLPEREVSGIAMVVHELATNALKYGALSVPGGQVRLTWTVTGNGRQVNLTWKEHGGPEVHPPESEGFGTFLLSRAALPLPHRVTLSYPADGVQARIALVLDETVDRP